MPASFLILRDDAPSRSTDGWHIPRPGRQTDSERLGRNLRCIVHTALERWTLRRLGSVDHERRVVELATDLFDITRPLHGLEPQDLRLLRWAATVHDIGRSVCDATHPEEGARLIRRERGLPLSAAERRQLTYLTLYHRGKVPTPGKDGILSASDDADRALRVLALLRAADGLDNRSLRRSRGCVPHIVFGLTHRSAERPTLQVKCYGDEWSRKAIQVYGRRKKFKLLEALLNVRVNPQLVVVPQHGQDSRAVA